MSMKYLTLYQPPKLTYFDNHVLTAQYFQLCNGTYYHRDTTPWVCQILENLRDSQQLCRLTLGIKQPTTNYYQALPADQQPGLCRIGRHYGTPVPVPLVLNVMTKEDRELSSIGKRRGRKISLSRLPTSTASCGEPLDSQHVVLIEQMNKSRHGGYETIYDWSLYNTSDSYDDSLEDACVLLPVQP